MGRLISSELERFTTALWLERGLSDNTREAYSRDVQGLNTWLLDQSRGNALTASESDVQAYLGARLSQGSSHRSISRLLSSLRSFYQYLVREGDVSSDPTQHLDRPKPSRPLPKSLSESEVDQLLNAPDASLVVEHRDLAMLEVLYASGLRVSELVGLTLPQLSLNQGVVRVFGKGGKERLVPLGEAAIETVTDYLGATRQALLKDRQSDVLFPSNRGKVMTRQTFWYRIKIYAKRAGIDPNLSPHTLRHAFATHLINHGADLRVVQMLLGHSDLTTTQIYTHVARSRMQALHEKHHPRG
ncbi:site-specific tyrosine recombinase XerD [Luminiphilus sp.]|nr:site-specific tyrosine recombinase XerD [Luminiphilus sp.]MDA8656956.1 site-specific tyrosine recombinase XerD [Luminiphilus sp.]MDA9950885.1 site-specific tyrosine recombinase XerD [Luminiphilus sp.]MDB2432907.1 site-specific tyrosine recombinase XerD [Luminiphilus sp.]MDB2557702.1 site-specific tyrosine recombinase XerD [Luminiphilus sp.]